MKSLLKAPIALLLALLARMIVHKYQPKVVMITGSVGKTSTKDAIAQALSAHFFVGASEKSYNSEFGVPLTIFGAENPWLNPLGWLRVFKKAFGLILLPNHYPSMLVLEVGADRPGDLARILRIATPDAVVVTRLPTVPVHVEAYASPQAVREEEFTPAYGLAASAPLILADDDTYAEEMALRIPARRLTYGMSSSATVRITDSGFYEEEGQVRGMRAILEVDREKVELIVRGSVGKTQLYPAAAAVAVASAFDIPLVESLKALEAYEPPPGRGRVFEGRHKTVIIDDSYNASPAAVEEALATLKAFPRAKRRIAVLGDMLELGRYSVAEHERIGTLAASAADIVVSVGIRARKLAEAARAARMPEGTLFSYDDSRSAAEALSAMIREGDVILVKGSQSIRTERIVEALIINQSDVSRLVRQDREWKRR